MYFLLIRPQQKRVKAHKLLYSSITNETVDRYLKDIIQTKNNELIFNKKYNNIIMNKIYLVKKYGNMQNFFKFVKKEINNSINTQTFDKMYDILRELPIR